MDREGQKESRAIERMEELNNKNKNKQSKRPMTWTGRGWDGVKKYVK
jgi:hypothetical protein